MADREKIKKSFEESLDWVAHEVVAWACDLVAATEREYTNEQARQRTLIATLVEALREIEEIGNRPQGYGPLHDASPTCADIAATALAAAKEAEAEVARLRAKIAELREENAQLRHWRT